MDKKHRHFLITLHIPRLIEGVYLRLSSWFTIRRRFYSENEGRWCLISRGNKLTRGLSCTHNFCSLQNWKFLPREPERKDYGATMIVMSICTPEKHLCPTVHSVIKSGHELFFNVMSIFCNKNDSTMFFFVIYLFTFLLLCFLVDSYFVMGNYE